MSIPISAASIQGKQRKEMIQEIKQKAKEAALYAVKDVLEAGLEAEVEHQLGRKKGETRYISSQPRQREWKCGYCGCQDANQFLRDGHYLRNLETGWGHIQGLRVPMLECQKCFHDVICHFSRLGEISTVVDRFGTRCALEQWPGAEFACNCAAMERPDRKQWGVAGAQ
jgi:hypothetical protein